MIEIEVFEKCMSTKVDNICNLKQNDVKKRVQ